MESAHSSDTSMALDNVAEGRARRFESQWAIKIFSWFKMAYIRAAVVAQW